MTRYNGNFNKFSSYLIGDILSIVPNEIYLLLGIAVAVVTFWYFLFNKLFAIFSGISGLVISFYALTATGPTIVLISSVVFFITYLLRKKSED